VKARMIPLELQRLFTRLQLIDRVSEYGMVIIISLMVMVLIVLVWH